ncbi:ribose/xylose/arabinose/galactoside ABC-type transport systems, permease components [Moorella thermoacetica Y72]|uniref:Ribose/xylose/arabinose/galactoside ABC-type transport systems, permease components n=1 Tax=Moorella thermoacetica Y72 TaxID=1325331 RepID=A0A0S6UDA3_NEOTH|nr:ABC transporter permease [Moorella thermoacetica]GAF25360.1 ribose/xylose/arabinose/galactoside ABC-type transport systems, permease components [Moorella thermoacetica Y72]
MEAVRKMGYSKIISMNLRRYSILVLLFILIIIATILSPHFLTVGNFLNLLQQSAVIGIVSIGMTFVIITGGIDLSVGSILALAGMIVGILLKNGMVISLAVLITLVAGALLGGISGFITTKARVPAFLATLAMMVAARGMALLATDGQPVFGLPPAFNVFGAGFFLGIPVSGIIWILLTLVAAFILKYSAFGRRLYAVGGNPEAAYLSGVKVNKIIAVTYIISGLLSAFAGIVLASWLTVSQPTAGSGAELNAIAAVVLGGASLSGGTGGVMGTFIGVLLMSIITNIFNLIGLSSYYQSIFMGVIIVLALVLNDFVVGGGEK